MCYQILPPRLLLFFLSFSSTYAEFLFFAVQGVTYDSHDVLFRRYGENSLSGVPILSSVFTVTSNNFFMFT
jgi:hypothetical protein